MHPNVAAYFAPNNRIQTTYCQAKLPTVRQAFSRYETSYLLSSRLSAVMKLAPNFRIHAPKRFRIHAPNFRIYFLLNI